MSNRLGFLKATDFSSKTSASSSTTIDQLPAEIHCKILKDLDPLDVLAFSRVCKLFYKYSDNQQLWWVRFPWLFQSVRIFRNHITMTLVSVNISSMKVKRHPRVYFWNEITVIFDVGNIIGWSSVARRLLHFHPNLPCQSSASISKTLAVGCGEFSSSRVLLVVSIPQNVSTAGCTPVGQSVSKTETEQLNTPSTSGASSLGSSRRAFW